jgi:hypothetical protein
MAETRTASAVKPKSFNDKDKPTEVRMSNIVAAKGIYIVLRHHHILL